MNHIDQANHKDNISENTNKFKILNLQPLDNQRNTLNQQLQRAIKDHQNQQHQPNRLVLHRRYHQVERPTQIPTTNQAAPEQKEGTY